MGKLLSQQQAWRAVTYIALGTFSLYCLLPFLWMVDTALKPLGEIRSATPSFAIAHPTLDNFRRVLVDTAFLAYFRNSVVVAVASTVLTMVVAIFAGYAMSRWATRRAVQVVSGALVASQMVPGVLLLVPLYMLMLRLHLLSTYASLILVYTTFMLPICSFMLKGYFDSVPAELEEAAEIDGCGRIETLFRVVLPLMGPGLLSTWAFAFINAWNEFMFGYVLINDEAHRTLTPGVMLFKGLYATDWGGLMAAAVLAVLPVALMFLYLQRFLIEGLAAGAVKG